MTEQSQGETTAAVTPRLVFDNSVTEDDIPAFLRKGKNKTPLREPGDPVTTTVTAAEPVDENIEALDNAEPDSAYTDQITEGSETMVKGIKGNEEIGMDDTSIEELQRQQEELDRKIREKRLAEKKAVLDQIKHVADTYKITIEEIVEAFGGMKVKRKGVKATQKYLDPKTGATWSGRGKEPTWIRGKNRDKFLIK